MTTILTKGNTVVKFLITKERAEKTITVEGNANTTVQTLTPLEANRQVNALLRQGYKAKPGKKP